MRETNHHHSITESKEIARVSRRKKKLNPKMRMTGKGMKRFACLPAGRQNHKNHQQVDELE